MSTTKKRILSIDGGGVRGKIVAQFLKRVEEKLKKPLYTYFDFYTGTSTGSFIVGGLAYEKMNCGMICDCIYSTDNAQKIMPHSIADDILGLVQNQPKYNGKGKREVIDEYVQDKLVSDTEKHVMVPGYDIVKDEAMFYRSYTESSARIRDALDVSSAAPCYLPAVESASEDGVIGIDGGVVANNPCDIAYAEALQLYGKEANIEIVSIGTGMSFSDVKSVHEARKALEYGSIQWIRKGWLIDILMNGAQELVHTKMEQFSSALGHKYIRVNGCITNTKMDDVSEENMEKLVATGNEWFDKFGQTLVEMLDA